METVSMSYEELDRASVIERVIPLRQLLVGERRRESPALMVCYPARTSEETSASSSR